MCYGRLCDITVAFQTSRRPGLCQSFLTTHTLSSAFPLVIFSQLRFIPLNGCSQGAIVFHFLLCCLALTFKQIPKISVRSVRDIGLLLEKESFQKHGMFLLISCQILFCTAHTHRAEQSAKQMRLLALTCREHDVAHTDIGCLY